MKNKINVIACGGAGCSIADKVIKDVADLGPGFAKIDIKYIDTSRSNIDKLDDENPDFWLVKSKGLSSEEIDGSGSERRSNAIDIMDNVKEYLDHHKIKSKVTGEYYVIVFSASGGSGSVIGPMLIKYLIERDIPTVGMVIGDSSCELSTLNTTKTLETLDSFARGAKKPLSLLYANNQAFIEGKTEAAAEKAVNQLMMNNLSAMALFLSGDNETLDNKDMSAFIDQSHYTSIDVKPGLYGLSAYSKEVILPQGARPSVARTLTTAGGDYDLVVTAKHSGSGENGSMTTRHKKYGMVTNENALSYYGEALPIHLITYANFFNNEVSALNRAIEEFKDIATKLDNQEIKSASGEVDSETGMVF